MRPRRRPLSSRETTTGRRSSPGGCRSTPSRPSPSIGYYSERADMIRDRRQSPDGGGLRGPEEARGSGGVSIQKSWSELQTMARPPASSSTPSTSSRRRRCRERPPPISTGSPGRHRAGRRPSRRSWDYRGFPATLCASVNEEVVHGIPGTRKLREGDIVGLDLGCILDGFFGDSARTVAVGKASEEAQQLMNATREALQAGVDMCRPDKRVGDIGHAVQAHAESPRLLGGPGVRGPRDRDQPARGAPGPELRPAGASGAAGARACAWRSSPWSMLGGPEVEVLDDGWTAVTKDRRLSAHFEFAVAVTDSRPLDPVGAVSVRGPERRPRMLEARVARGAGGGGNGAGAPSQCALPGGAVERGSTLGDRASRRRHRLDAAAAGGRSRGGDCPLRRGAGPHREAAMTARGTGK